jgi:hypothetical protein
MRRLLFLAIILFAVMPVGRGPHWDGPVPAAAQAGERVEFRKAPPSCAQAIKELHLEGQPVNCEEPPPPTYDPPQMHGPYRLIAPTYVGPLAYRDDPAPAFPVGVVSEDSEVVQRSPLYRPPAWMPQGYALETLRTGDTGSEDAVGAVYTGPGQPVSITWVRRYTRPIDVILPGPDSVLALEAVTVQDKPGVLWYPKPGSSAASGLRASLSYMEGDVEVTIMGQGLDPDTAKAIARSIACGAACASAGPSEAWAEGLPDAPSADSATSSDGGERGSPAPAGSAQLVTGELRILEGLATPSSIVNVSYHEAPEDSYWHGFIYPFDYDEAALDLTDPEGNTPGRNVYYLAWLDAAGASITATTEDYQIGSRCTGRYVRLTEVHDPNHVLGRLTYVHLAPESMRDPGDQWTSGSMWTVRFLGTPATSQECHFTGPHLHQGQTLASSQTMYNAALPNLGGVIDPTGDHINNWMHSVIFDIADDFDGDGCANGEELAGAPPPKPGSTGQYNPYSYWDFFSVPVPPNPDPAPSGPRDQAVAMADVLAVLFYVGTSDNGPPNPNGVDYDSLKDGDWTFDTVVTELEDQVGLRFDRSPSAPPNPPNGAGAPSGAVSMADVLAVLAQVGLQCTGGWVGAGDGGGQQPDGDGALDLAPNAVAVDAIPGGAVNPVRWWLGGSPFDIDVVLTAAGESYAGYDLALSYDDQILQFVPTADLDGDTVLESWAYTGLGSMSLNATVMRSDLDGDTVLEKLAGGSGRSSGTISATGAVVTARFRCIGNGTSAVHLVSPGTTTLGVGGATIDTSLADANVSCFGVQ